METKDTNIGEVTNKVIGKVANHFVTVQCDKATAFSVAKFFNKLLSKKNKKTIIVAPHVDISIDIEHDATITKVISGKLGDPSEGL